MKYRNDKYGNRISQLGYGCMRFTKKGASIDYKKAEREVLLAIDNGINYFDTAYIYPGSEECLGKILADNGVREKVNIATKLPQFALKSLESADKIFAEELKRLQTEYIDYYLMHMFTEYSEWEKLCKMGMPDWIAEKKAEGRIKNIGFSYHGEPEMFLKILDAYDWDFCRYNTITLTKTPKRGKEGLKPRRKKGYRLL